jgi:hypothetical protein
VKLVSYTEVKNGLKITENIVVKRIVGYKKD